MMHLGRGGKGGDEEDCLVAGEGGAREAKAVSTLCKKETGERDGGKGKRGKEEEVMQREKRGELAKRGREKMERWRGEKVSQLNSHRAMYKERRGGKKKKAKGSLLAKGTYFSPEF